MPLALAASLIGAVLAGWLWMRRAPAPAGPPVALVARVEWLAGEVNLDSRLATGVGAELAAGTTVATAPGEPPARVALRFASGSVRLDAGTRVRLVSASRLELERGAVYVDSDPAAAGGGGLEVETALGLVREIGTQFEVRLEDRGAGALEVRVREGRIEIEGARETHPVAAGERLRLSDDGSAERRPLAPDASEWGWVIAAAPTPEIEGMSLRAFLDWSCRETGRSLRFEDPSLESTAAGIVLHGTIEGLGHEEALGVVLAGAGLEHRVEAGSLVIRTPR